MRKDKEKVLDEVWTEDHVKSFLDVRPHDGTDENFHMLLKAYQSMRASDFELFLGFFTADKRDVDAHGKDGRTLLDIVSTHRHGVEYADILKAAGAGYERPSGCSGCSVYRNAYLLAPADVGEPSRKGHSAATKFGCCATRQFLLRKNLDSNSARRKPRIWWRR